MGPLKIIRISRFNVGQPFTGFQGCKKFVYCKPKLHYIQNVPKSIDFICSSVWQQWNTISDALEWQFAWGRRITFFLFPMVCRHRSNMQTLMLGVDAEKGNLDVKSFINSNIPNSRFFEVSSLRAKWNIASTSQYLREYGTPECTENNAPPSKPGDKYPAAERIVHSN